MNVVVYIASPYSGYADKRAAVAAQIDAFAALLEMGFEPIAPLLAHYVEEHYPTAYERWLQGGMALVERCDLVLRLPGESGGADREVARAIELGKPVVYGIEELQALMQPPVDCGALEVQS